MYPNRALSFIVAAITLSILTTNICLTTPAMASSKGGGSVTQEQVNTGNSNLDKEINKFYSCISKTHQDPPSKQIVDDCYSQNSIAGISGPGSINHHYNNNHNNNNNIETPSTSNSRIATTPPGVLVEVP